MTESNSSFDVTAENFNEIVIAGSARQLVIADFWADWCQPCQALMPVLHKLNEAYQGKFHLAKINSDQQQELTAQFGVRSLPTVKFFLNGEVVDEFMGVLPETEIRAKLDQYIIHESDNLIAQAQMLIAENSLDEAENLLTEANTAEPGRPQVITTLASLYINKGRLDDAENLLNTLPSGEEENSEAASLLNTIEFTRQTASLPQLDDLINVVKDNPEDLQARYDLSLRLVAENNHPAAMQQLLDIMQKDRKFKDDIGRTTLLKLFDTSADKVAVAHYRREMFNLLY